MNLGSHGNKSQFGKATPYLITAFIALIVIMFYCSKL